MANFSLPSDLTDQIILSDWLELLAIISPDNNASHGDLERELTRAGVDNGDTICNSTLGELNQRVIAAGNNYPFTFSGSLLKLKNGWQSFTPYIFCLLLSYCDDAKKKVAKINHEVMFEYLSCLAAKKYIDGEVLRFGSPRKNDPLPSGFLNAMTDVCGAVGEWSCSTASNTLRKKDGGLDLIAWKPFPDRQIGKLILFGHCASGNNWHSKINELQPGDFCSRWLGGDKSPIVKSFFIPYRVTTEVFADRAISAKLFFDRCRIALWAVNDEFSRITKNENIRWCKQVLKKINQ